jgi:hypothetical protein
MPLRRRKAEDKREKEIMIGVPPEAWNSIVRPESRRPWLPAPDQRDRAAGGRRGGDEELGQAQAFRLDAPLHPDVSPARSARGHGLLPRLSAAPEPEGVRGPGESLEEKEHSLFGKEGFEKVVAEVARLEKQLGIYELAGFTPGQRG